MDQCDICEEMGLNECLYCSLGNPCYGCDDYDIKNNTCRSNGGCAEGGQDDAVMD